MNFQKSLLLFLVFSVLLFQGCSDDGVEKAPGKVEFDFGVSASYTSIEVTGSMTSSGISSVKEKGFIYREAGYTDELNLESGTSKFLASTLDENVKTFSINSQLKDNKQYEIRAYLIENKTGEVYYSDVKNFTTLEKKVSFLFESLIPSTNSVQMIVSMKTEGITSVKEKGFLYKLKTGEALSIYTGTKYAAESLQEGGVVYGIMNEFTPDTKYNLCAYLVDTDNKVYYSEIFEFTTLEQKAVFTFHSIQAYNVQSIVLEVSLKLEGIAGVKEKGFIYKIKNGQALTIETGTKYLAPALAEGSVMFGINGLAHNTTYEVRGFVIDTNDKVFLSDVQEFTTLND